MSFIHNAKIKVKAEGDCSKQGKISYRKTY